jgi:putative transposase
MRKSRFTESQICRDPEGGRGRRPRGRAAADARTDLVRLKELEAENAKLKRLYAEMALENAAIKDVLSRKL